MSLPTSVLSFLATRFSAHPENIATEALNYILDRSEAAREALTRVATTFGLTGLSELAFKTQVSDATGARPDIVGCAVDGRVCVILEAKFWAGLTDMQPVGYVGALGEDEPGLLLFVAPEARSETLWPELRRRIAEAGFTTVAQPNPNGRTRSVVLERNGHVLALISWRTLLETLADATRADGDISTGEDLRQLSALCEQMDTEAFLPIRSEELTSTLGRRIMQFNGLVDDLANQLVAQGLADVKGLKASATREYYLRYMRLNRYGACLQFNSANWATWGDSPIWLGVKGVDWQVAPDVVAALRRADIGFREGSTSFCQIPIYLKAGVEREEVFAHALMQITRVADALPEITSEPMPAPPDTDDSSSAVSAVNESGATPV